MISLVEIKNYDFFIGNKSLQEMDGNFLLYDIFIVSLMNRFLLNSCDTSNYTYNFWRRLVINKLESICLLGKKCGLSFHNLSSNPFLRLVIAPARDHLYMSHITQRRCKKSSAGKIHSATRGSLPRNGIQPAQVC